MVLTASGGGGEAFIRFFLCSNLHVPYGCTAWNLTSKIGTSVLFRCASDQLIHDCFCLLNGIAPRFKVVHQIRIFLVKTDGKKSVLFFDREALIVDWRFKFWPMWKTPRVVGIHLGVEVITPLLQFFLTVLVSDWMPWIVAGDPAMAVEA